MDVGNDPVGFATVDASGGNGDDPKLVRIVGEVDISVVDDMRSTVFEALGDRGAPVVLDLSGVEFMDSSGISLLLEIGRHAGDVSVRDASTAAQLVIEATGLAGWLPQER